MIIFGTFYTPCHLELLTSIFSLYVLLHLTTHGQWEVWKEDFKFLFIYLFYYFININWTNDRKI